MQVISACPSCQVQLATSNYDAESIARCAACGWQFSLDADLYGLPEKNTKATASVILGGFSFLGLFLTGIPAIILGWLALKDIREKKTAGGKTKAILGVTLGSVFSLLCGGTVVGLAAFVWSVRPTEDPAVISEARAFLGEAEFPEEVEPKNALSIFGMRTLAYSDAGRGTRILQFYYPIHFCPTKASALGRSQSSRLGLSLETRDKFSVSTDEGPIEITEEWGTDDGDPIRVYTGTMTHGNKDNPGGWVVFQIRVNEEKLGKQTKADDDKPPLFYISKEQVIRIFETYKSGPN